jgi:hypothetical protein
VAFGSAHGVALVDCGSGTTAPAATVSPTAGDRGVGGGGGGGRGGGVGSGGGGGLRVFVWGSNRKGQLGLGSATEACPTPVPLPIDGALARRRGGVVGVFACDQYSACVTAEGELWTWGTSGCLGHAANPQQQPKGGAAVAMVAMTVPVPTQVVLPGLASGDGVAAVGLGSLYAGCTTTDGALYA